MKLQFYSQFFIFFYFLFLQKKNSPRAEQLLAFFCGNLATPRVRLWSGLAKFLLTLLFVSFSTMCLIKNAEMSLWTTFQECLLLVLQIFPPLC
jgi:hypothetical protein